MALLYENLEKEKYKLIEQGERLLEGHKKSNPKIQNQNEIKFKIYHVRDKYDCVLPDEILLIILNKIHTVMVSLVSYQFYTVNRPFAARCYHLHHHIPQIQKILSPLKVNHFDLDSSDKSPHICVIDFGTTINMYQFNNINMDLRDMSIEGTDIDLIDMVDKVMLHDPYVYCKMDKIGYENEIKKQYDYTLLTEMKDYVNIGKILNQNMVKIIEIYNDAITNPMIMVDVYHTILDFFDDKNLLITILNQFSNNKINQPFNFLLQNIPNSQVFLKTFADLLLKNMNDNNNIKDYISDILNLSNFIVKTENCIFLLYQYKQPLKQFINANLLPEYQWVADQL